MDNAYISKHMVMHMMDYHQHQQCAVMQCGVTNARDVLLLFIRIESHFIEVDVNKNILG